MNKKGNIFLGLVLGIFVWIMGILFMPFLIEVLDVSRTDLSCSTTAISFGTKLICLSGDLIIPYLIWTLAVIFLGLVVGRSR